MSWENYGDTLSRLRTSLADMSKRDKGGFNSNRSAALTDYVTCDDAFDEMGVPSPLAKTNARLRNITGNSLYLATLLHLSKLFVLFLVSQSFGYSFFFGYFSFGYVGANE